MEFQALKSKIEVLCVGVLFSKSHLRKLICHHHQHQHLHTIIITFTSPPPPLLFLLLLSLPPPLLALPPPPPSSLCNNHCFQCHDHHCCCHHLHNLYDHCFYTTSAHCCCRHHHTPLLSSSPPPLPLWPSLPIMTSVFILPPSPSQSYNRRHCCYHNNFLAFGYAHPNDWNY